MLREALTRLKARAEGAATEPSYWGDVAYGLGLLRESDTVSLDGRVDLLHDLQRRALAAESTHDPAVVQDLIQAVTAFLDEELTEAIEARAADAAEQEAAMQTDPAAGIDATTTDEQLGARKAAAEADAFMQYAPTKADEKPEGDADVATNARRTAAEADNFARYGDAPSGDQPTDSTKEGNMSADRTIACEACGHQNAMPAPSAPAAMGESAALTEAERKISDLTAENTKLREAKQPDPAAATQATKLTEAERVELIGLRKMKERARLREAATKAIKDAEASGWVKEDDLLEFTESQWPALIKGWAGPPTEYGTGERAMPGEQGRPGRKSAADVFNESLGQ